MATRDLGRAAHHDGPGAVATMCAAFQRTVAVHGDVVALRAPADAAGLTWREYGERVRRVAAGLHGLGLRRGDTLALMLTNRPEFHLVDSAAMHLGATPYSERKQRAKWAPSQKPASTATDVTLLPVWDRSQRAWARRRRR